MAKLEEDVENPEKSTLFSKYPKFIKDHHMLYFVCDTLRTAVAGVVAPHDLESCWKTISRSHHNEISGPARALAAWPTHFPDWESWRLFSAS